MSVRVRFAPSPTGELHIGGARTALFNWLFARHHHGSFILRIENTDMERSQGDFTRSIIDNLRWMGLDWDEGPEVGGERGPYYQSQRLAVYKKYAAKLIHEGRAYHCYCSLEELDERKRLRQQRGQAVVYDGKCRNLPPQEQERLLQAGRRPTIRFKAEDTGSIQIHDALRGNVTFENAIMGDFIIVRSDGTPTYNFANVIDDALMEITHVIRGDDHLSNTPRQALLYQALNFDLPVFAHIPMILGPDGAKLSKRHGAQSLTYYRDQGYYSWAVANYLALLGWSTSESQQFFQRDGLIRAFSLEGVNKSAAVFDIQKLDSMNAHYIREMDIEELKAHVLPYLETKGWVDARTQTRTEARLNRIVELARDRMHRFSDIVDVAGFFFETDFCYDEKAVEKRLLNTYSMTVLQEVRQNLASIQTLTESSFEDLLRNLSKQLQLTTSKVFHAVRVALTGKMTGPGLFELAVVLGKEEVVHRLTRTIGLLKNQEILAAGTSR